MSIGQSSEVVNSINGHDPPTIPQYLLACNQWLVRRGKVPADPDTGQPVSKTVPDNWMAFERATAHAASNAHLSGVGFVLTSHDPFAVIDLDGCRNPDTGEMEEWAWKIIKAFDSYTETSPSGTGVHVWVYGTVRGRNVFHIDGHKIEAYSRDRFITVTGDRVDGMPGEIANGQGILDGWASTEKPGAPKHEKPSGRSPFGEDEDTLITEAERISGEKFRALFYNGDLREYGGDDSAARAGLIGILRWYAHDDRDQIERIMRRANLDQTRWDENRVGKTRIVYEIDRLTADPLSSYYEPNGGGISFVHIKDTHERKKEVSDDGISFVHGDGPNEEKKPERLIRFVTLQDLLDEGGEEPDYIVPGYLARGGLTDLAGRAKFSGKTTWTLLLVGCVLDGRPFMGLPTQKTRVLYLTEQGVNFVQAAKSAGLDPDHAGLLVLPWKNTRGFNWPEIIEAVKEQAREFGAGVVVVDTLNRFAGLKGEEENNAGHVRAAMDPLLEAAQVENLALLSIRHANKEGGPRGSTQFDHDVDQLLTLRRPQNGGYGDNVRELEAVGRYSNNTVLIELTDDGYVSLGDDKNAKRNQAEWAIREVVSADPENPTRKAWIEQQLKQVHDISPATTRRALEYLRDAAELEEVRLSAPGAPLAYYCDPLVSIEIGGEEVWRLPEELRAFYRRKLDQGTAQTAKPPCE